MSILSETDIKNQLTALQGWEYSDGKIMKTYSFSNYMNSIAFINRLAEKAEEYNHHPDMIVEWCKITVSFTSHDNGGVTDSCIKMSVETDRIYK